MTRNNDKLDQLRAVIPHSNAARENAAHADAYKHAARSPTAWAETMHTEWKSGHLAPLGGSDGELRARALILAIRRLEADDTRKDLAKMARDLRVFLRDAWGLRRAADAVGGQDRDSHRELLEHWGDDQLPPPGAIVGGIAADERLIRALVKRVSG